MFQEPIDWKIAQIKEMYTRGVFVAILEAMNHNTNQLRVGPEFRDKFERRALTRSLGKLEEIKYIRRAQSNGSWDIIWVNPEITHPVWMTRLELMDWQTSFNVGPTNLSAKINEWFRQNELDRLNESGD